MPRFLLLTVVLTLSGCGAVGSLTGSTGKVSVEGLDDRMESQVWVTTSTYSSPLVLSIGNANPSFRALINKDGGRVIFYQIYATANSRDWMFWNGARYLNPTNQELVEFDEVLRIGSNVDCSRYGCSHYESVGITVDKDFIEAAASSSTPITVRLSSRTSTATLDFEVDPAEARAFLSSVQETVTTLGGSSLTATGAPEAPVETEGGTNPQPNN